MLMNHRLHDITRFRDEVKSYRVCCATNSEMEMNTFFQMRKQKEEYRSTLYTKKQAMKGLTWH